MKKIMIWAMMLTSILCVSCAKSEDGDEDKLGSIYGIVTKLGTAEPMKAVGVELYKKGTSSSKDALLLKTVTFDDGHFEFKNLTPEHYQVKVVADGYEQIEEGYVIVEAGRQARIDLQVKNTEPDYVMIGNLMIQRYDYGPLSDWTQAEGICETSSISGYTDWRMPTLDELRIIYSMRSKIPNLKSSKYCCFYYGTYGSGYIDFSTGEVGQSALDGPYYVRAVRTIE